MNTHGPRPTQFQKPRQVAKFGPKTKPLEDRFAEKVVERKNGCWGWTGNKNNMGYGMLYDRDTGRKELAHRVSRRLVDGEYSTQPVLHTCDNPSCVNPDHLVVGTQAENMIDKAVKGRGSNQHQAATMEQAREIVTRYREGESQQKLADAFGFDQTYISRVVTGRIIHLREALR